jgi:hypothetical protein
MSVRNDLSPEFVLSILSYDPETGDLTWKHRTDMPNFWNARYAGKTAGCPHNMGYTRIRINEISYLAHRLIWLIVTGIWPDKQIDHINGIRSDNRLINLRKASSSNNNANKTLKNATGYKGVSKWEKDGLVYYNARVTKDYKTRSLGYFKTPEEAYKAYCKAASDTHGEFFKSR